MNPQTMRQWRLRAARVIRKLATRITPPPESTGVSYANIGAEHLPKGAPRALIFFDIAGVQRLLEGKWPNDPIFKHHTIKGDAVAMVQELNKQGYIVDYCDLWKVTGKDIDWDRYAIVIDNWDNLRYAPAVVGQTKIAFVNGWHWINQNAGELERIAWFKERTGIVVPTNRQVAPNFSDEYADYMTYYGTPTQPLAFSAHPKKHLINLCALCGPAPKEHKKNIESARHKYIWIGGGGMLLKGLDLIIEAFALMPEVDLYIVGNLQEEPRFWSWAEPLIQKHSNIHALGWMDTTSPTFDAVADQCIATVYASASEGGPASVARVLFNGCIPIVTASSFVRAESLGYTITGASSSELIKSIVDCVQNLITLPTQELEEKSQAVRSFAFKYHTREAFAESFSALIKAVSRL